jgi:hypothetical protein
MSRNSACGAKALRVQDIAAYTMQSIQEPLRRSQVVGLSSHTFSLNHDELNSAQVELHVAPQFSEQAFAVFLSNEESRIYNMLEDTSLRSG